MVSDTAILRKLESRPHHVSGLARALQANRTTVAYRLKRLRTQGEVAQSSRGKRNAAFWELSSKPKKTKARIQVFTDREYTRVYASLFDLPSHSVVYAVQGKQALQDALRLIPKYLIFKTRDMYKRRNIAIKGIVSQEYFKVFNTVSDSMLQAHTNNTLGARCVATKMFTGAGELLVSRQFMIMTHIKKRRSILIKDEAMVDMCYEIVSLLFDALENGNNTYTADLNQIYKDALALRKSR